MRLSCCFMLSVLWGTLGSAYGAGPGLEWAYETKGKVYASPIVVDLDGDGTAEVVACASREGRILCLDGGGDVRWDYRMEDQSGDGIQATPSAVDYDGDGKKEVFFVTTGGTVGCLDYHGRLIWRAFTGDKTDYSGPVLADIDSDGEIEIVFGSDSGTVYCYDDAGVQKWHHQGDGQVRGIPAVAYHPPSGTMRVYVTFGGGDSACLSSEGEVVWSHHEPAVRNERRSGPAVGDLDGDGTLEVVLATEDGHVVVRDAFSGEERWRWKAQNKIDQTHSFALADFDGSGRLDVVCGDGTGLGGPGYVYRLRDGKALWTADVGGGVVQGPSVGDVDGDGKLEVLVCSRSKRLICLSDEGKEQWSFSTDAGSLTTPAMGDIDSDGEVEIVFGSKDRFLYCLTVGGAYDPARLPWPMMNRDPQLSGNALGAAYAAPPAPQGTIDEVLWIDRFGPLSAGVNTILFSFNNDAYRPRHLEAVAAVTRPDGSQVTETATGRIEAYETKSASFDLAAAEDGMYRLALRLVDVGTGETLAVKEAEFELDAFAQMEAQLDVLVREARKGTKALPKGPARTRAETRAEELKAVSDVIRRGRSLGGGEGERAATIEEAQAGLEQWERFVARLRAAVRTPGGAGEFAVAPDTTLRKVFGDEPYATPELTATLGDAPQATMSLARNEYEGVQLVVVPLWKDLSTLRVSVTPLTHEDGDATIPPTDVAVQRIGYVTIGPSEYNWYVEKQGEYPDITFGDEPIDVSADREAQPYFITVHAGPNLKAGVYRGTIRVEAEGCPGVDVPLQVRVWDFALPDETTLKVSMWMGEGYLQRFYQYEGRVPFEVRKRFYDYHLEHRTSPIKGFPLGGGEMIEDFEYLIANGQNNFFIGVPEYLGPDNREALTEQYRATRDLLVEKGWNDLAMFYTRDEVAVMARHIIPKVVEMNHWIHEVVPEWPRLQTSAPEQSLFDSIDIWCPTIDHFDPVVLEERMKKGDRLWFYTVWGRPGIMIEFPATDHRLMFWECWKYGAEGFLYWGTTHWDLNCVGEERWPEVPWVPYNRQPGHNGCGYLLYPGPDGTPLGSIRFELVRDGIEDYEYLCLLQTLLDQGGEAMPEKLRKRVEDELAVSPEVLVDYKEFTEDPGAILGARGRIGGLIEELGRTTGARGGGK